MKHFYIIIFFGFLLISCGDPADVLLEKAIKSYVDKDYEKSRDLMLNAIDGELVTYEKHKAYTVLGNIYKELGKLDSSVLFHRKSVELKPNYADAWVNLGITYRLQKKYDLAEQAYQNAMKANPQKPELYTSLGALFIFQGKGSEAVEALEKSINFLDEQKVAHANLAIAYAMVGNFERARESLQRAIQLGYDKPGVIKSKIEKYEGLVL
jgi:tetratricopeptide (TPR) repeat protein